MALSDVYSDLHSSLNNGQIDLYGAARQYQSLSPLQEVLALFTITSPYIVTGAQLAQPGAVTLAGQATWQPTGAPASTPVTVSLVVQSGSGSAPPQFTLTLSVNTTGWTFSTMFPTLPDTQVKTTNSSAVSWNGSFLIGLPLADPEFSGSGPAPAGGPPPQLHLRGNLRLAGPLQQYTDLFGSQPLALAGRVTLPTVAGGVPAMDLTALSPTLAFTIANLSLRGAGLNLVVANDLDADTWGRTAFSVLNFVASFELDPIRGTVTVVPLASGDSWRFLLTFEQPLGIGGAITAIARLLDVSPTMLVVPEGFDSWTGFGVNEIELTVDKPTMPGATKVKRIAVTLASSRQWNTPIRFVRIRGVRARWVVGWMTVAGVWKPRFLSAAIGGTVWVGDTPPLPALPRPTLTAPDPLLEDAVGFNIDIVAYLPHFVITGELRSNDTIPIGTAFQYFFGNTGPPTQTGMQITALNFVADPGERTYEASATITMDWTVPLLGMVSLALQALSFTISSTQGTLAGAITGDFLLRSQSGDTTDQPRFNVGAEYAGADSTDGWIFRGGLYPNSQVNLTQLVFNLLNVTPPGSLPTVSLVALTVEFATTSRRYELAGTVAGRWTPSIFGNTLTISASASVDVTRSAGEPAQGWLTGRFAVNRIAVEATITLLVDQPTYTFKVEIDDHWLSATTGWRKPTGAAPAHQILTLWLGGNHVTLGDMLEYLVNLAAPTLGFRLESPWDVLKQIDLSRFAVTVDPTERSVELTYDANVDLTIMRIDRIGVRYTRTAGEPSVDLLLYGNFLGKDYTDTPVSWDLVRDPPPSIGAGGDSILDLRYLGLGQRIAPRDPYPDTIRESIQQLIAALKPPADPNANPLSQPSGQGMAFAADSQWLIGLDLTLLDTVDVAVVFNDPRLYGLSLGLRGERAGSLAGLRFELLYKKITNDVGMFRVELVVPETFRHLELGEVSITLGVVVVEIYTNGNFLIDLGFPYNRNFDRSFTVQVFPFVGRGGIYFGLLDGNTSRRVPAITNGTLAPVVELGIGLAVGVGKDVTLGPLSGGIYVQVEVLFQGVLGWFNPSSSAVAPANYFWAQGIAAIHGKLYGKVDFAIIKVSVTIEAYAQATVVLEAYKAALFRLDVGVSVEAGVDLFLFSVSFSFDAHLDVSFTVGSDQPTPWTLAGGTSRPSMMPAPRRMPHIRDRALAGHHVAARRRARLLAIDGASGACSTYALTWLPTVAVFPAARPLSLTMLPSFSVTNVPINWSATPPVNPSPQYQVTFLLFAPNGVAAGANRRARAPRSAQGSLQALDTNSLAADILIEALLRWSISAVTGSPGQDPTKQVTVGQLATLIEQMACPQTRDAFSVTNLGTFLKTNAPLQIAGDPGTLPPSSRGGMVFPMPPALSWTSPQAGDCNFARQMLVGPWYEWGIALYIAQYFPQDAVGPKPSTDDPATYESFAAYVFRDYCLMVAKAAAQAARDALSDWPVTLTANASLQSVAQLFPTTTVTYLVRAGDTLDSVATAVGTSAIELLYLNPTLPATLSTATPGMSVGVVLGISPESVAIDNAGVTLASGIALTLGTVDYQVQATTLTLTQVAQRFHLANAAALLTPALSADPLLLTAGATFPTPQVTFTPPAGMPVLLVAATFFVRYAAPDVPYTDWYAQTVFDLNATMPNAFVGDSSIPTGTTLQVPPAYNDPSPAHAVTYVTVADDTVTRIGAALSLAQNFGTGTEPSQAWATFRAGVTMTGGVATIPASTVIIQPRDTLNGLAARTIVNAGNLAQLIAWLADASVLRPLAVIDVPNVAAQTGRDGATIAQIATYYGLTISQVAALMPTQAIFTATPQAPVTLRAQHVPVQGIDALVQCVMSGDAPEDISAAVSRYLLSGLRLPGPQADGTHVVATGALTPLYALTGQQFAGPSPTAPGTALSVTVTVNTGIDWIELDSSSTVGPDEDYAAIVARAPAARNPRYNPGLAPHRVVAGAVVLTGPVSQLVFSYTGAQLPYPATGLAIVPTAGPAAMKLASRSPRTYGLDHRIALQSATPLAIPQTQSTAAGNASLWPLPPDLRTRAGSTVAFDIVRSAHHDNDRNADVVTSSTFGTLASFVVRRSAGVEGVYDIVGADATGRDVLLTLWHYLVGASQAGGDDVPPTATQAYLLIAPAPDAADSSGLSVLPIDGGATFLIKTNESVETQLGALRKEATGGDVAATAGKYYASFNDLASFVLLLWEGSVVGGTGYYLRLATTAGNAIPLSAFDQNDQATFSLLTIAGTQQAPAPGGRTLLAIDTCALVAPGLDAATHALSVEAATPQGSDLITVATLPPGSVGYTLSRSIPAGTSGQDQLQAYFSLAIVSINASNGYSLVPSGLPATPQRDTSGGLELWELRRAARRRRAARPPVDAVTPTWKYDQVVPISRFGPASAAPAVPGLPDPAADPYRGIGGTTLVSTTLQLGFADVVGNVTAPPAAGSGTVTVNVGYTDPLLSVGAWPAVTLSYTVAPQTGQPVNLVVVASSQPASRVATPEQSAAVGAAAASRQAEQYQTAWFQLVQPGMTDSSRQPSPCSIVTSLQPQPMAVNPFSLALFAAANYAAARSAAAVTALPVSGTLGNAVTTYGVAYDALAAAHGHLSARLLFGTAVLTIPVFAVFHDGDTANLIVANIRTGWPTPGSGAALLSLNDSLPLRVGVVLAYPPAPVTVPTPPPTLAALAASQDTSPARLAADSAPDRNVLAANFKFTMDGLTVTVGETTLPSGATVNTFADVVTAFAAIGVIVTVADLATSSATTAGLLTGAAVMHTAHYQAVDGDTLAHNASGIRAAVLASANAGTVNLFDAGAVLAIGSTTGSAATSGIDHTLDDFAAQYACPSALLLAANGQVPLPAGSPFVVPGTAALPPAASLAVPYGIGAQESLATIAAKCSGAAPLPIATTNQMLPWTVAAGQTVTVGAFSTPTQPGDSFYAVWQRLYAQSSTITFEQVVAAIAASPAYLAQGSLLIVPPAALPVTSPSSPDDIPGLYHITGVAFAQANAVFTGLVAPNVTLSSPDRSVLITTRANDTMNALVARFAQQLALVTIADIVTANHQVAFFAAGALALLPPAPVSLSASLGASVGPFAQPISPLTVTLRLTRPAGVIAPEFSQGGAGPVERAETTVPAPSRPQGATAATELTLADFVRTFESAFPALRVASGKASGSSADIWVVDFGASGISQVTVAPGVTGPSGARWPRFFALRPLYNVLVQRLGVPLASLLDDGTLSPTTTPTNFQDVDVETWARRFLADVDLFLTGPYATAVYANAAARGALDAVLDAKATLAAAISRGLAVTLVVDDPMAAAGRSAAIAALVQQLQINLSQAYATAAVVQYDVTVTSPWTAPAPPVPPLLPARLVGIVTPMATPSAPAVGDTPAALPYTMAGAKIDLTTPHSYLSLFTSVTDPQHHGALQVNPKYEVLDAEFNIRTLADVGGYESSNWVAFVNRLPHDGPPAIQFQMGTAIVPVPLRNYPALPVILAQQARASWTGAGDPPLGQVAFWTYGITYTHQHAGQDQVQLSVTFNVRPSSPIGTDDQSPDVASALAKYIAVADPLWALLSDIVDPAASTPPATLANAAVTFSSFVADIAGAWNGRWPAESPAPTNWQPAAVAIGPPTQTYDFAVHLTGATEYSTLELTRLQAQPGPTNQWPDVYFVAENGTRIPLTVGTATGETMTYSFPSTPPIHVVEWPRVAVEWPGLAIATVQNARASMSVRRNEHLLGPDMPNTTSDFVYQTGTVEAPDIATPLLTWPRRFILGGTTVTEALQAALTALFGTATGLPLTVSFFYGYELVPAQGSDDGITVHLPASLYPNQQLGTGTAAAIGGAVSAWDSKYQPTHVGGEWLFTLTVYSQLDAVATRPLLTVERLVYRIPSAVSLLG
ncbi:MAG TPA: LysM domain-containing protein [Vicinamibacterales bacterium]|nr:LysM domain-containing protein [Vicinamibacterales bacterium]